MRGTSPTTTQQPGAFAKVLMLETMGNIKSKDLSFWQVFLYGLKERIMKRILTSESVNIGHPDKTCDTIADAFLDEALRQDKNAQMAVECSIKNDKLFIYGEASTTARIDYDKIAQDILRDIGYETPFSIIKEISVQSPDIHQAVVKEKLCANDQGIVFGYATNETKEFMPLPILLAHKIMKQYEAFRRRSSNFFADAKCQVSVEYDDDRPSCIDTILISVSHSPNCKQVDRKIKDGVLLPVLEEYKDFVKRPIKFIINPSGRFVIWGSFGDSGTVGRKIVVDTYGGVGRVGGGCFSSKNATKVDRSGAYYARFVAKNLVSAGLCERCEVEVSYGIGLDRPLSINLETFGTNSVPMKKLYEIVSQNFDFSPDNIIKELDLLRPIYKQTACYGHFGHSEYPWEKIKPLDI